MNRKVSEQMSHRARLQNIADQNGGIFRTSDLAKLGYDRKYMDIQRAKELLAVLSDGVNPLTGELLPEDDSCNQVEIVRALNTVLRYLDNQPQRPSKPSPDNAGKPWTAEDEEALSRMFEQGCTKKEICSYFKRSPGAIAARLVKLGKISERDQFRRS